jgi:hypothetical protein
MYLVQYMKRDKDITCVRITEIYEICTTHLQPLPRFEHINVTSEQADLIRMKRSFSLLDCLR